MSGSPVEAAMLEALIAKNRRPDEETSAASDGAAAVPPPTGRAAMRPIENKNTVGAASASGAEPSEAQPVQPKGRAALLAKLKAQIAAGQTAPAPSQPATAEDKSEKSPPGSGVFPRPSPPSSESPKSLDLPKTPSPTQPSPERSSSAAQAAEKLGKMMIQEEIKSPITRQGKGGKKVSPTVNYVRLEVEKGSGNCANIMSGVNLEPFRRSGTTRRLHIKKLINLSNEIDLLCQQFHNDKIKGNGTSLAGGACAVVSGVATIATGGLALPVLATLGSATGVLGGLWNYMGTKKKAEHEQRIKTEIQNIVKEDEILREEVRTEIEKYNILDSSKKNAVAEQILAIVKGWSSVFISLGPEMAFCALTAALPPIGMFFTNIPAIMTFLGVVSTGATKFFAKETIEEVGDEAIRAAVERVGKTLPKNWTKRYIIENAYGEIVKKNGGKLVVKLSAEGVEAFADEAAKEIAKQAKHVAQWVGGVTAGVGVITCIWDMYQIKDAWGKSGQGYTTKLGAALRKIAKEMEASIDNTNRNIGA